MEKINDKYFKKLEENFKNIENILLKSKISEFDTRVCCLEMRFAIENMCYNQLEKYGNILSEEEKERYYEADKIIKKIIQMYNPFITKNGHNIKIISDNNEINLNQETVSTKILSKVYNQLGKKLHSEQPFEDNTEFNKEKLEEIFDTIKSFRAAFGTLMSPNRATCAECKEVFYFQKTLNIKAIKNEKKLEEMSVYCPFCLTEYEIIDDKKLRTKPLKATFTDKRTDEKIFVHSNISIRRIIEDVRSKILKIEDFSKIPNDYIEYDFYRDNGEKFPVCVNLQKLFELCPLE